MSDKVVIFDTTLRDGEQSPGISLDVAEKLEIAEQLARARRRLHRGRLPRGEPGGLRGRAGHRPSVGHGEPRPSAASSRTQLSDVDRCWDAVRDAERTRIHVFISTSPSHMEHMLKMNEAQVLAEVRRGVARAREHTDDVEFSPQDATRTPLDFMLEVLRASVEAGATTLNIPDTVGYGIPWDFGDLIAARPQARCPATTSCRRTATTTSASPPPTAWPGSRPGARQVEVCVNGLGERAGNAALEEVVMALADPPRPVPRAHHHGAYRGAGPDEPARGRSDRLPGPVEQGRRRQQRLRPRVRASTSTACCRPLDLRDHRRRLASARSAGRSSSASTRAATPSPSTLEKMGIPVQGDGLNPPSPASRSSPTARSRSPRPTSRRSWPRSSARTGRGGFHLEALEVAGGTVGMPRARVVVSRDGRQGRRPPPKATA